MLWTKCCTWTMLPFRLPGFSKHSYLWSSARPREDLVFNSDDLGFQQGCGLCRQSVYAGWDLVSKVPQTTAESSREERTESQEFRKTSSRDRTDTGKSLGPLWLSSENQTYAQHCKHWSYLVVPEATCLWLQSKPRSVLWLICSNFIASWSIISSSFKIHP